MSVCVEVKAFSVLRAPSTEISNDTLGLSSVQEAAKLAIALMCEDAQVAADARDFLNIDLSYTRSRVASIHEDHDDALEQFCDNSMPPMLVQAMKDNPKTKTWKDWFATAPTGQVLNALQWNVHNTHRLQNDPEVKAAITNKKEEYKGALDAAVSSEWLPQKVLQRISRVDTTDVYIGDTFDTYLQDRSGYYERGKPQVVIGGERTNGNYTQSTLRHIKSTLTLPHELTHAAVGKFNERWINEAVTEHITASLFLGDEQVIHPAERVVFDPVYKSEREILHYVLTLGKQPVSSQQVINAYVDNLLLQTKAPTCQELYAAIDRSWLGDEKTSKSFVNHIEDAITQLKEVFMTSNENMRESVALCKATEEVANIMRVGDAGVVVAISKEYDLQKKRKQRQSPHIHVGGSVG